MIENLLETKTILTMLFNSYYSKILLCYTLIAFIFMLFYSKPVRRFIYIPVILVWLIILNNVIYNQFFKDLANLSKFFVILPSSVIIAFCFTEILKNKKRDLTLIPFFIIACAFIILSFKYVATV